MKRRIFSLLISCILMCSLSVSVYAEETAKYTLGELGLTVSMPSDYVIFTRDIDANDPNLSSYGLTKADMSSLMTSRNIYLNGWDKDVNHEIIITMVDSPLMDLNLYSDTTLSTMATTLDAEYAAMGITVIKFEIYQHAQAKFLKVYISQPDGDYTVYGLQYHTVYTDKAINITMQSYSGEISSSNEATLKDIVDNVVFDTAPQMPESEVTPTSAFEYTDPKTRTTFTVPANWIESPLFETREFIDVKFDSLQEEGMCILYSSHDLWAEMTDAERAGYSRSNADNSIFTKSDVAAIYGISSDDISMVTYGETEYFKATVPLTSTVEGMDFSTTMTYTILIDNGYMYFFQFSGADDNEYYGDFESLLSSTKTGGADFTSRFSFGNILLSLLITIVVYSLPIFIYRYGIRKAPVTPAMAKRIIIVYGICAFVVMSVMIFKNSGSGAAGGGILLWSYINYCMLTRGKITEAATGTELETESEFVTDAELAVDTESEEPEETIDVEQQETTLQSDTVAIDSIECCDDAAQRYAAGGTSSEEKTEVNYCHKCGNKLHPDSLFCNKCGAKIPVEKEGKM